MEDVAGANDTFGIAVALGDFDSDGRADLAAGVLEDVGSAHGAGAVNVIYGSGSGLSATVIPDQLWHQDSPEVEDAAEAGDRLGFSLTA